MVYELFDLKIRFLMNLLDVYYQEKRIYYKTDLFCI